jgi:hypothetical protein
MVVDEAEWPKFPRADHPFAPKPDDCGMTVNCSSKTHALLTKFKDLPVSDLVSLRIDRLQYDVTPI